MGQKLRRSELNFQRSNTHAFAEMKKILYTHQLDLIRAGRHLEDTMPTHSDEAVVISFDIISSSQIKNALVKDFLRHVFAACNAIMMEGYDGIALKANAYRIKELGDGFLCSVCYPFAAMSANPARDAVRLAHRFAEVLERESRRFSLEEPVHCGIGIATDVITGFYPEGGAKEYDLYGRSIVLATRYEGMRKMLFKNEGGGSLLILQEKIFDALDESDRQGFSRIEMRERRITVRDDPDATCLYFKSLVVGEAQRATA